jgi:hypothetical protein
MEVDMLSAELDGQKGYAVFHNGETRFFTSKVEAESLEKEIADERHRAALRRNIAKAIRAYVKNAREAFKGDRDAYARAIRSELKRTEEIAQAIEDDAILAIPDIGK